MAIMSAAADPRPVTDADAAALTALVAAAYREHPGCVLDLPGVDADLAAPATTAARRGGRWWVVEDAGRVVASVGTGPVTGGEVELKRLYVAASHRRQGLAAALVGRVEAHAGGIGAHRVGLWSDTRFVAAHHLYTWLGYERTGATRQLHDPSHTTETRFARTVAPLVPRRTVTWNGPRGLDTCRLTDLPDGAVLAGAAADVRYRVEVDAGWATRTVEVEDGTGVRWLTSDGAGRWWTDGDRTEVLDGCVDADVEATPATNTLPIRRLAAAGVHDATVAAAWVRVPGPDVIRRDQRYVRTAGSSWTCAAGAFTAELAVDDDGLVERYGQLWRLVTGSEP